MSTTPVATGKQIVPLSLQVRIINKPAHTLAGPIKRTLDDLSEDRCIRTRDG